MLSFSFYLFVQPLQTHFISSKLQENVLLVSWSKKRRRVFSCGFITSPLCSSEVWGGEQLDSVTSAPPRSRSPPRFHLVCVQTSSRSRSFERLFVGFKVKSGGLAGICSRSSGACWTFCAPVRVVPGNSEPSFPLQGAQNVPGKHTALPSLTEHVSCNWINN